MLLTETLQKNGCPSHHQLTIGKKGPFRRGFSESDFEVLQVLRFRPGIQIRPQQDVAVLDFEISDSRSEAPDTWLRPLFTKHEGQDENYDVRSEG